MDTQYAKAQQEILDARAAAEEMLQKQLQAQQEKIDEQAQTINCQKEQLGQKATQATELEGALGIANTTNMTQQAIIQQLQEQQARFARSNKRKRFVSGLVFGIGTALVAAGVVALFVPIVGTLFALGLIAIGGTAIVSSGAHVLPFLRCNNNHSAEKQEEVPSQPAAPTNKAYQQTRTRNRKNQTSRRSTPPPHASSNGFFSASTSASDSSRTSKLLVEKLPSSISFGRGSSA